MVKRNYLMGKSSAVIKKLMAPYLGKGHFFILTTVIQALLCQFLHDNKTGSCGTVRKNTKFMPNLTNQINQTTKDHPAPKTRGANLSDSIKKNTYRERRRAKSSPSSGMTDVTFAFSPSSTQGRW